MKTIALPRFIDEAVLISTQDKKSVPFAIRRVFIIRNIKSKAIRGKHAHKKTKQALFCIQGSMKVKLSDGKKTVVHRLTKPNVGIFINQMTWSEMYDFSRDAIVLVFASDVYKNRDYIRDYQAFLRKAR